MARLKLLLDFVVLFLLDIVCSYETSTQNIGIATHNAENKLRSDLGLGHGANDFVHVLPPHTNTTPVKVDVDISPILIKDLDAKSQTLTMEAWFRLSWTDSRIQWLPDDYGGISVLRVPDHQIWQPDLTIYNTARASEIDPQNNVYALIYHDGDVVWIPPVTMYTICTVDLKYYPYDEHKCLVKVGSWTHDGHHIDLDLFSKDNNDTNESTVNMSDTWNEGGEWELVSGTSKRNVIKYPCCKEHYPDVTFELVIRRRSPTYKLTILCPIIAAVCLALASFWLSPYTYERITIDCLSLLVLVLTLLHLAETIPSAGVHSPLIVCFCGYVTVLVAIMTIVSIVFLSILRGQRDRPVPHWMHRVLNSWASDVFCVNSSSPTTFEPFSNNMDRAKLEVDSEDPHQMNMEVKQLNNNYHWFRFFQLVDHITFVIFALITVIVLLVLST